jgi:hypothetical protein
VLPSSPPRIPIYNRHRFRLIYAAVNKLFYSDNLDILRRSIRDDTVDHAYIDSPFISNPNYDQIYNNIEGEDVAQGTELMDIAQSTCWLIEV